MGGKVRNDNYIVIQGFMINELKLKGNELIIYAIIYGFSQAEGQVFSGSLQYLADWTNSTKQGVTKSLKGLVEKGYIQKNDKYINGVKFCEYHATKLDEVYNKVEQGIQQSCIGGVQQSCTNNIDLNNTNNNINNNIENPKRKVFKKPTKEEVEEYCKERNNNVDPENFIDYYESNGWRVGNNPMKDWKASVRTWERRNNNNNNNSNNTKKPIRKEIVPEWFGKEIEAKDATEEEIEELNRKIAANESWRKEAERLQEELRNKY